MSASNGITPEVIRGVMPPYQLNPDLLQATLAALPRPPSDATPAWRQARIARLTQEISERMPANAVQARDAAQSIISRELADALTTLALTPGTEFPLVCRLARTATTVMQTAVMLDRSLTRQQQKPAAFFGTVLSDAVDIPALDATWHANPDHQPQPAPNAEAPPTQRPPAPPNPAPDQPGATPPDLTPAQPQPAHPPNPAAPAGPDDTTPEWSITKLDEGPGWSREVLRHRSSREGGNGSAPGTPT